MNDVLGVELKIEPGTAIGNNPRRKQEFAGRMGFTLVVVEEHTGRTMHLRDNHALRAVHDKRAHIRHQGHIAHVDVLLLDVANRPRTGFFIDIEHDQTECHLQRRRIRNVALLAFLNVVFRLFELVAYELQRAPLREIADRKDRLEDFLETAVTAIFNLSMDLQEGIIGTLLHFDQVRHRRHCANASEILTNALTLCKRLCHGDLSRIQNLPTRMRRLNINSECCRTAPRRGRQTSGS